MLAHLKDLIRAQNQRRRAHRLANRPAVQTPLGFQFVGPRLMQEGRYEAALGAFIAQLIALGDRFVNVGANAGYYCAIAQTKGVETIAFEPNPETFALLTRNMQMNGWGDRITTLPLAAGASSGFLTLYGEGTGASLVRGWAGNPTGGTTVPVARLDTLIQRPQPGEKVVFLLDVEGHEFAALSGAHSLIASDPKPIWIVEVSSTVHQPGGTSTNPDYAATLTLFRDAGYEVISTSQSMQKVSWDDALKGFVGVDGENFVFCSASDVERVIAAGT